MTPKEIIFDNLKTRFAGYDVETLLISYFFDSKKTECSLKLKDKSVLTDKLSFTENLMFRNMILSKITNMLDYEISRIHIKIDLTTEQINLYVLKIGNTELNKVDFNL